MNKCRVPRTPPIISNSKLLINCIEKAQCFNNFFLSDWKTNVHNSTLPALSYLTDSCLGIIQIIENEIKSIIMSLNPNKTHWCDNISKQMLQLCVLSIHIPQGIIFRNIGITGIFPDQWKLAITAPSPCYQSLPKYLRKLYLIIFIGIS